MRDIFTDFTPDLSDPDPVRRSQIAMKKPLAKRFYTDVTVKPVESGFAIELDGRTIKTPARNLLVVPISPVLVEAIAVSFQVVMLSASLKFSCA